MWAIVPKQRLTHPDAPLLHLKRLAISSQPSLHDPDCLETRRHKWMGFSTSPRGGTPSLPEHRDRLAVLQEKKWEVFGKRRLYRRLLKHCIVLAVFQLGLLLPRTTAAPADPVADWHLLLRPLCEAVVVGNALHKGYVEVRELYSSGVAGYFGLGKAFVFENVCSLAHVAAVGAACAGRACGGAEDPAVENMALMLAAVTHWLYLAWFMLGFQLTGPFIISAIEMLATDIPAFLIAVSVFMGAFASGMYILSAKVGVHFMLQDFEVCGERMGGGQLAAAHPWIRPSGGSEPPTPGLCTRLTRGAPCTLEHHRFGILVGLRHIPPAPGFLSQVCLMALFGSHPMEHFEETLSLWPLVAKVCQPPALCNTHHKGIFSSGWDSLRFSCRHCLHVIDRHCY